MNFTELYTELKQSSGFSNLTEARAAYFLNGALRYLEGRLPLYESMVCDSVSLAADAYTITISAGTDTGQSGALSIESVYRQNLDTYECTLLSYVPFNLLIDKYPKLGSSDVGTPAYWSYNSYDKDTPNTNAATMQIIVMPPTDTTINLRIDYRISMSDFLSTDTTKTNVWATSYPHVLIKAAILQIEQHYGNTTRTQALLDGIELDLDAIDKVIASRDLVIGNLMERATVLTSTLYVNKDEDDE